MKAKKPKDMAAIFREGTLIKKALAAGVREALRRHKQAGCPIVVWRNGKTVWIPADKIKVPGENRRHRGKSRAAKKSSRIHPRRDSHGDDASGLPCGGRRRRGGHGRPDRAGG